MTEFQQNVTIGSNPDLGGAPGHAPPTLNQYNDAAARTGWARKKTRLRANTVGVGPAADELKFSSARTNAEGKERTAPSAKPNERDRRTRKKAAANPAPPARKRMDSQGSNTGLRGSRSRNPTSHTLVTANAARAASLARRCRRPSRSRATSMGDAVGSRVSTSRRRRVR